MTAKGSLAWYRRNDRVPLDPAADRARRLQTARANGMFDEFSERHAFEAWFADSRRGKGADYAARELLKHLDGSYVSDSTQRHWWTWQHAVGGGRLLPKFDPYKLAADRLERLADKPQPA